MNITTSPKIRTILSAVVLSIFVIVLGAVETQAMSFQTFVGQDAPITCGPYDDIFNGGQCIDGVQNNGSGEVLGDQDGSNTGVNIIDNRCVLNDGVVELELWEIKLYELVNQSNGDLTSRGAVAATFQTFTDLSDGNYKFKGTGDSGSDTAYFTVDCDPDTPVNPSVSASCRVTPKSPVIGDEVTWQASATDGDGDYSYNWSGDVGGSDKNISIIYTETGEKDGYVTVRSNGSHDTARCSIQVTGDDDGGGGDDDDDEDDEEEEDEDEEGDNTDESPFSRTIEEF